MTSQDSTTCPDDVAFTLIGPRPFGDLTASDLRDGANDLEENRGWLGRQRDPARQRQEPPPDEIVALRELADELERPGEESPRRRRSWAQLARAYRSNSAP